MDVEIIIGAMVEISIEMAVKKQMMVTGGLLMTSKRATGIIMLLMTDKGFQSIIATLIIITEEGMIIMAIGHLIIKGEMKINYVNGLSNEMIR